MSPDIHLGHALGVVGDESAALDKISSFGMVNFGDLPAFQDVDALHIHDQAHVHMSFKTGGSIGGIHFRDEDVLSFASPSRTMTVGGSANDIAWIPADLDAWSSVTVLSLIFRGVFEQEF